MEPGNNKKVITALAILLLLLAVFLFSRRGSDIKVDKGFYDDAGSRAASEVVERLGITSAAVISLPADNSPPYSIFRKALIDGLSDRGVDVAMEEVVPADTDEALNALLGSGSFPSHVFFTVMNGAPGVDAVISLAGTPRISDEEFDAFTGQGKQVVICSLSRRVEDLGVLLDRGSVALAVIPARRASTSKQFNDRFEILTGAGVP